MGIPLKMPIVIFHGYQDALINYRSSIKLNQIIKMADTVIPAEGPLQKHITPPPEYQEALQKLLILTLEFFPKMRPIFP